MGHLSQEDLQLWIQDQGERMRERRTGRVRQCAKYLLEKWKKENESNVTPNSPVPLLLRAIIKEDDPMSTEDAKSYISPSRKTIPKTIISDDGEIIYTEVPAMPPSLINKVTTVSDQDSSWDPVQSTPNSEGSEGGIGSPIPGPLWPARLLTKGETGEWETSPTLSSQLHEAKRHLAMKESLPVEGTTLIIGAGQRSIGFMLARLLLQAGHRVALCTGRLTAENRKTISQMYKKYAKPGAELVLFPFNQGSIQDIDNLVNHINDALGWEIDHLVPFAAVSTNGKNLEDIDSVSELALRIMLTNTL